MHCDNAKGFTLVETLVAAVILFTCMAAAALSYNTAIRLANKLNATVYIDTAVPEIRDAVKGHLMAGAFNGKAPYADDIEYSWEAVERRSSQTITGSYDENTGGLEYGRFYVSLLSVALKVTLTRYSEPQSAHFEYTELVWRNI